MHCPRDAHALQHADESGSLRRLQMSARRTVLSAAFTALITVAAPEIRADGPPAPDSPEATRFEYASPEAALAALRERPGVILHEEDGWILADDKANYTLWSFAPPDHPAYPAAVKRVIVKAPDGDLSIVMTARCGASKAACDKLIAEFRATNERIVENIRAGAKRKQ